MLLYYFCVHCSIIHPLNSLNCFTTATLSVLYFKHAISSVTFTTTICFSCVYFVVYRVCLRTRSFSTRRRRLNESLSILHYLDRSTLEHLLCSIKKFFPCRYIRRLHYTKQHLVLSPLSCILTHHWSVVKSEKLTILVFGENSVLYTLSKKTKKSSCFWI